jgi:hypothetical protein
MRNTGRNMITRWQAAVCGIVLGAVASSALAAEPGPCDNRHFLSNLKETFAMQQEMAHQSTKFKVGDAKELGYGPPPKGVNQYAPSKDYYNKSRYCQATITLEDGTTELTYYRIDGRKEPDVTEYNFDVCFPKHNNIFKDQCMRVRPGG